MKKNHHTVVKLQIADVVIRMQSEFALERFSKKEQAVHHQERFDNFLYGGSKKPDIIIDIKLSEKLPQNLGGKDIFITYHPDGHSENWRLQKSGDSYIYRCPIKDKCQFMLVNKDFDRVVAYLLPKKNKGSVWSISDIIYDFLQVLLINYFALNNNGIFVHSIGVKDKDGKGLLFAGKSGAGKSTMARLWCAHSKATVLNDDRVIVRRSNGKFFIYGSPWHGEFNDYLKSRIESAPLEKLFFIHHFPRNTCRIIPEGRTLHFLYPALFPPFWDKPCLENTVSFCRDLVESLPFFKLGFVNNKKIIDFVRKI
jgi:hypothetical protein